MSNSENPLFTAMKTKLRFPAPGRSAQLLAPEDLCDLSLKDLDTMAVAADAAITQSGTKSFLENPDRRATAARAEQELRLEILKMVIDDKQTENKARKQASEIKARREFLEGLKQKKMIDQLEGLSLAEIDAQLAALG